MNMLVLSSQISSCDVFFFSNTMHSIIMQVMVNHVLKFLMKNIRCRLLGAVLALVLVHILLFSTFCVRHDQRFSRDTFLSRKLLSSSSSSSSSDSASRSERKLSGNKKQTKKAVEPSLRKAPSSVPNPTQNK
ncbi:uncharacterized protein LOC114192709 [Vigna unguiculata]|nr:uncharacterized protein LOC114192709 [Vigna unguiculata]